MTITIYAIVEEGIAEATKNITISIIGSEFTCNTGDPLDGFEQDGSTGS